METPIYGKGMGARKHTGGRTHAWRLHGSVMSSGKECETGKIEGKERTLGVQGSDTESAGWEGCTGQESVNTGGEE